MIRDLISAFRKSTRPSGRGQHRESHADGGPGAFPSISAALAALDPNGANTITVSGTCSDNIFIDEFHNLFIESAPAQTE
jgi:hypothetical protein